MTDLPPRRKPYLIMAPEDRIGTPHIPVDPEKVVAIVESDYPDQTQANAPEDDTSRLVTLHHSSDMLYNPFMPRCHFQPVLVQLSSERVLQEPKRYTAGSNPTCFLSELFVLPHLHRRY